MFKKLYDLFELECHPLDVDILQQQARAKSQDDDEDESMTTDFDKKIAAELSRKKKVEKDLEEKCKELEDLEEEIPFLSWTSRTTTEAMN